MSLSHSRLDKSHREIKKILDIARVKRSFFKRIGMYIELYLYRKSKGKK